MLERFYPEEISDSAYDIDYKKLYEDGYRGIIYDIDNTLVPDNAPADERSIELIRRLKEMGFRCLVLSNNHEPRVKSFADEVGADYIFDAGKPLAKSYLDAVERMGTNADTTLFVGDQLFTDIWGAKNAGLRNILVKRINNKERVRIKLKRLLERLVFLSYDQKLKADGKR